MISTRFEDATPQITVRLFKSIARKTIDGQTAVSFRYEWKSDFIDLTPYLSDGSSVRTSKSIREPAGGFNIMFADKPQVQPDEAWADALESVYGLVEPMDVIEIRMWGGLGPVPDGDLPIKMRGFVTGVQRSQSMTPEGRPQRFVTISGQDYGKVWQMFQVLHLQAYAERKALLSSYGLWEMFGVEAKGTMSSSEFVKTMVEKVLNPFLDKFLPTHSRIKRKLLTDLISVKHGVVNDSYQSTQGSVFDILKFHADVGYWNELYVEDLEDGVHVVYRPCPYLSLTAKAGTTNRLIQDDAPEIMICSIPDHMITSLTSARSDANVANFYWVNNSRFDLIDEMQRKLAAISEDSNKVFIKEYPNSAVKYYATRPMYASTQQGDDQLVNMGSGLKQAPHDARTALQEAWIDKRRRLLVEMNKDNVVYESGTAVVKGGRMRPDGEMMKAGDYALFQTGAIDYLAYVTQIEDEFLPFRSYTSTLTYERGEGFVTRNMMEGGADSPWLAEQSRSGGWSNL